jgi:hypothetical protein
MMNAAKALKQFDIDPKVGKQRAVQTIGEMITSAPDPLSVANSVLVAFGGAEVLDFPTARITAKALVEQAVEAGEAFDLDKAQAYAAEKVQKLRGEQPEVFVKTVADAASEPKRRGRPSTKTASGESLKDKALKICADNASMTNAQLAKLIQTELKITYSNAYYYASRVFKR